MEVKYETVQKVVKKVKEQHRYYDNLQLRTLYRLFLKAFEENSYRNNSKGVALEVHLPNKMPIAGAMGLALAKFNYYCVRENWKHSTNVFSNILKLMPMPSSNKEQDYRNWLIMLEAIVMELHNR